MRDISLLPSLAETFARKAGTYAREAIRRAPEKKESQ
jgi:hypothetical protein